MVSNHVILVADRNHLYFSFQRLAIFKAMLIFDTANLNKLLLMVPKNFRRFFSQDCLILLLDFFPVFLKVAEADQHNFSFLFDAPQYLNVCHFFYPKECQNSAIYPQLKSLQLLHIVLPQCLQFYIIFILSKFESLQFRNETQMSLFNFEDLELFVTS